MKIYVDTDIEGVAGICTFDQSKKKVGDYYEESRHLLTKEVNAVVKGALGGGADEIIVRDAHGGGGNFVPEELIAGGRYLMGINKPRPLTGLTEEFKGVIMFGYHPMSMTEPGVLSHTQNSRAIKHYWLNGREIGEIGLHAAVMGCFAVPVLLVTGSEAACSEARDFLGENLPVLQVKEDCSRQSAITIAPAESRKLIEDKVKKVVSKDPVVEPYRVETPVEMKVEFRDKEYADESGIPEEMRVNDTTFENTVATPLKYHPKYWCS